ncbi:hypothetical protein QKU48_gp1096 [Fadolivirus algeromassiliense]|jgi:hypothetical protein|uniref:Uncharacterized protein n=1 Tax=Fadolivirus FV1/VV64 TaxID=3070911 RepID=A0A7D3UW64_9VIRU|nr:hypothetical protein QKU48_gp1096 [Fadolivirus algeromassiliense]QKF94554.1 hypothetical protein Fadolivirus_1_1096 [Fadolivirus FV1/VV64]
MEIHNILDKILRIHNRQIVIDSIINITTKKHTINDILNNIKKISGISNLDILKKDDRLFILFSQLPNEIKSCVDCKIEDGCINIEDLPKYLANMIPYENINFYAGYTHNKKNGKSSCNPENKLYVKYLDCVNNINCSPKNIRVHYTNIYNKYVHIFLLNLYFNHIRIIIKQESLLNSDSTEEYIDNIINKAKIPTKITDYIKHIGDHYEELDIGKCIKILTLFEDFDMNEIQISRNICNIYDIDYEKYETYLNIMRPEDKERIKSNISSNFFYNKFKETKKTSIYDVISDIAAYYDIRENFIIDFEDFIRTIIVITVYLDYFFNIIKSLWLVETTENIHSNIILIEDEYINILEVKKILRGRGYDELKNISMHDEIQNKLESGSNFNICLELK